MLYTGSGPLPEPVSCNMFFSKDAELASGWKIFWLRGSLHLFSSKSISHKVVSVLKTFPSLMRFLTRWEGHDHHLDCSRLSEAY